MVKERVPCTLYQYYPEKKAGRKRRNLRPFTDVSVKKKPFYILEWMDNTWVARESATCDHQNAVSSHIGGGECSAWCGCWRINKVKTWSSNRGSCSSEGSWEKGSTVYFWCVGHFCWGGVSLFTSQAQQCWCQMNRTTTTTTDNMEALPWHLYPFLKLHLISLNFQLPSLPNSDMQAAETWLNSPKTSH